MIKKLYLENFRMFERKTFYFNRGINLILAPNHCGKSTILEAIRFGLYGRTLRGYSLKHLIRYGYDHSTVEIIIQEKDMKDIPILRELVHKEDRIEHSVKKNDVELRIKETREFVSEIVSNPYVYNLFVSAPQKELQGVLDKSSKAIPQLLATFPGTEEINKAIQNLENILTRTRREGIVFKELAIQDYRKEDTTYIEHEMKNIEKKLDNLRRKRGKIKNEINNLEEKYFEVREFSRTLDSLSRRIFNEFENLQRIIRERLERITRLSDELHFLLNRDPSERFRFELESIQKFKKIINRIKEWKHCSKDLLTQIHVSSRTIDIKEGYNFLVNEDAHKDFHVNIQKLKNIVSADQSHSRTVLEMFNTLKIKKEEEFSKYKARIQRNTNALELLTFALDKDLKNCPVCYQSISRNNLLKAEIELQKVSEALETEKKIFSDLPDSIKGINQQFHNILSMDNSIKNIISSLEQDVYKIQNVLYKFNQMSADVEQPDFLKSFAKIEQKQDSLLEELTELDRLIGNNELKLWDIGRELKQKNRIKNKVREAEIDLARAENKLEITKLVNEVFHRTRIRLRRDSIEDIVKSTNLSMKELFPSVKTSVSEIGELQIADKEQIVPYETLSGAEKEALNICLRIATVRTLKNTDFLLLDEPGAFFDAQLLEKFISQLIELKKFIPQIILVTHRSIFKKMRPENTYSFDSNEKAWIRENYL